MIPGGEVLFASQHQTRRLSRELWEVEEEDEGGEGEDDAAGGGGGVASLFSFVSLPLE